jgi:hypothetical protein
MASRKEKKLAEFNKNIEKIKTKAIKQKDKKNKKWK